MYTIKNDSNLNNALVLVYLSIILKKCKRCFFLLNNSSKLFMKHFQALFVCLFNKKTQSKKRKLNKKPNNNLTSVKHDLNY
ncbi:hypothetical protein BpHYR1_019999 [Brachionus plicatilis]|uniref:Uncharacterized protein n=1 Tax=Brachionus plicatilis TaxID=10195 RepID=A0A3M7QZP3_BRAPC|nr:hypothetical protein BpHYR1_019999 [Brachionus plicatilis]